LQPAPEAISFFDLFGISPTLLPDPEALRAKFYELSKIVHPDRFADSHGQEATYSARWASLVNRAYQTLRDREKTALYLLGGELKSNKVPLDLAETYFDLQDALGEPDGKAKLVEFQKDLQKQREASEAGWAAVNEKWLATKDNSLIQTQLTRDRYLDSMLADIEKKL